MTKLLSNRYRKRGKNNEVFWRSYGETYVKTFSHTEESYMNNFIRDLHERLNVDYIEKVTHENISC